MRNRRLRIANLPICILMMIMGVEMTHLLPWWIGAAQVVAGALLFYLNADLLLPK